jgi:hypothetical protein
VQDLLGELLAHLVLEAAAVGEECRKPLRARQREQAPLAQQQAHGGADRPAGGLRHVGNLEVEPAGALAARRRDQAHHAAVAEQTRGHPSLPEETLHPHVRRRLERSAVTHRAVGVLAGLKDAHQQLPGRRPVHGSALADRQVRPQRLAVVGQFDLELAWDRDAVHAGVPLGREAPPEHLAREESEVDDHGLGPFARRELALLDAGAQARLALGVTSLEDGAGLHERRRRHHESGGLDEAEPFEVREHVRIGPGHRQFVSGHR